METSVRPIPGECSRYYVTSSSRPEIVHIVDMEWQECPGDQPRPLCGCEESFAKGKVCRHIKRVLEWLKNLHETTDP